jgi:uncharacterized protein YndB with AHSA1/START domain
VIACREMKTAILLSMLLLSITASPEATAAVTESHENAFTIEATVLVAATPASTYRDLTRVNLWWDPAHTWSGFAKNLKLEPKAGGCFCEKLIEGGSVQHGRVIFAQPGKMLRLQAALGPLQGMAVTGVLSFILAAEGSETRVTMTYRVAGALTMESAKLAPLVDQVMGTQLQRLGNFASGRPAGP